MDALYPTTLAAALLVFLATCVIYFRQEQASVAHPATLYLAFHGFVFVFRPIIAWLYDFDFVYRLYEFRPSIGDKLTVVVGATLAMLVFVTASLAFCRRNVPEVAAERFAAARAMFAKPVLLTTVLLAPAAIYSQIGNWSRRANEFDTMVRDAATGVQVNTVNVGWLTDLGLILAPLSVMVLWQSRYRWWGWLFFAGFALLQSGSGTRGPLVYAVLAIGMLYLLERGRRWVDPRSFALLAMTALAFNVIVIDRGSAVRQIFVDEPQSRLTNLRDLQPLEHMDFANMEYFEYVVHAVPQRTGSYDYFANNLQIFTEPVPRALWKHKPVGSPVQFFNLWDYGKPIGITVSMPGIGWMSLGWIGIVIQSLVTALAYGLAYRWLAVRRAGPVAFLSYVLVAATAIVVFRDGALVSVMRVVPFYLGPLVVVLLLARLYGWRQSPTVQINMAAPDPEASPRARRERLAEMVAER
ncbi:hypothetical protein GRI38_13230 [Altererythrobacter aurantiacus]|uniref:Oligosaccharide repeat unit polymerase n=1 Tax=Parapontixanthobacter aurantiacus TaxID=1463599 RepID=A0A844ZJ17_9SPHN|nr:O-antigen polymerase [Parapontixanthobacter aurantiacus]MXO86990.1 hypothetical protein [Parapontixanthobacter aurantiacus]